MAEKYVAFAHRELDKEGNILRMEIFSDIEKCCDSIKERLTASGIRNSFSNKGKEISLDEVINILKNEESFILCDTVFRIEFYTLDELLDLVNGYWKLDGFQDWKRIFFVHSKKL